MHCIHISAEATSLAGYETSVVVVILFNTYRCLSGMDPIYYGAPAKPAAPLHDFPVVNSIHIFPEMSFQDVSDAEHI